MLTGRDQGLQLSDIGGIFTGKNDTGNVVLSISQKAQQAAADALGGQRGAVVAIDVRTGEIVAMFSNPTYNPNLMASHDSQVVQATYNAINSDTEAGVGAHLQRDLPAGLVVQDHHQRRRARHRARDAARSLLSRRRIHRPPPDDRPPLQLRW